MAPKSYRYDQSKAKNKYATTYLGYLHPNARQRNMDQHVEGKGAVLGPA